MAKILVTGHQSGLGAAIYGALNDEGHWMVPWPHDHPWDDYDVRRPNAAIPDDLDILINNAGINRIDWLEKFEEEDWDNVVDTNAKGIYMMTRAALPALKATQGTILNIVSNAAHMPMTGSLAYNASKGAAHIMTLQLARELGRQHNITVFGIAPNRLANTGMSKYIDKRVVETRGWTVEEARKYQLGSLPAGEETEPRVLANFIAYLLKTKVRHKYLQGCILPYGA